MMAEAGVPILVGSDATPWVFPGFSIHDELELLVEAGLTRLQALQAAVLNPARADLDRLLAEVEASVEQASKQE